MSKDGGEGRGRSPRIEAFIGTSGSGKGIGIVRRVAELKPARLVIWDPRAEYAAQAGAVRDLPALVEALRRAGKGPARVRYVPGSGVKLAEAFGLVCDVAFTWGDCVFIAEELSDVTTPGWAPGPWRRCITQGRHRGLHVIGAAQRPTLIDKTFLANCTRVRCCAVGYDSDRRTMARELRVSEAAVDALQAMHDHEAGRHALDYLERDRSTGALTAGKITIEGGRLREKRQPAKDPT